MYNKYNSTKNIDKEMMINQVRDMGWLDKEYFITEKAHGANFQINYDGEKFVCGSRNGELKSGEIFNNWEQILENHKPKLERLWNRIRGDYQYYYKKPLEKITLFGELIGGMYNHADVERNNHACKVQRKAKMSYTPDNEFCVFEYRLNDKVCPRESLDAIGEVISLNIIPILFEGTLEECMNYDSRRQSTIYQMFHLPEIEDNLSEGIIISPVEPLYFNSGERVIFKKVNEEYQEKQRVKPPKAPIVFSDDVKKVLDIIAQYINENRLEHIFSHIGNKTKEQFIEILKPFIKDVMEEFSQDHSELLSVLSKADKKIVSGSVGKMCSQTILDYFKEN